MQSRDGKLWTKEAGNFRMTEPLRKQGRRGWGLEKVQKSFCSSSNAFCFFKLKLEKIGKNVSTCQM